MGYYNNEQEGTPSQRLIKRLMNAQKGQRYFVSAIDEKQLRLRENFIRTGIHFNLDLKGIIKFKTVKDANNIRIGYTVERLK